MRWQQALPWNWFREEEMNYPDVHPLHPARSPISSLHNDVDALFNQALRGFGMGFGLPVSEEGSSMSKLLLKPKLNIHESAEAYNIDVEVAGVDKDNLNIDIDGHTLCIAGEKKLEKEEDKDNYHCIERSFGSFRRTLNLPNDADPERLSAEVDKGVLHLIISRRDAPNEPLKRHIEIT